MGGKCNGICEFMEENLREKKRMQQQFKTNKKRFVKLRKQ